MNEETRLLEPSETDRCAALIREYAAANRLEIVRWLPIPSLEGESYGGIWNNSWMAVAYRGGWDFVLIRVLFSAGEKTAKVYLEEQQAALKLLRERTAVYAAATNAHREALGLVGQHGMLAKSHDSTYQGDFYAWILGVQQAMYERTFDGLEWETIGDEWGGLASLERERIEARLNDLLMLLLEVGDPKTSCLCRDDHTYERAADEARRDIRKILNDSPSLVPHVPGQLQSAWRQARHVVLMLSYEADEQRAGDALPDKCPWNFEQVMDKGLWPRGRLG